MNDDSARIKCRRVGQPGHLYCGVCPDCDAPRFMCGHSATHPEGEQ